MNNYLFFRTDRIGDFLVSAILIKSIKRNDKNAHISVVTSSKNHFYVKSLDFIDDVFLYPNSFIKKFFFFLNLKKKKYKLICSLDGKKRSIYFSIFLKSQIKILMTTKKLFKNIFNYFFTKIYYFNETNNKLEEILDVLNLSNMSFKEEDINFLKKRNNFSEKIKRINNYAIFHFDEKWIFEQYIKKYKSIQPNFEEFKKFIDDLVDKSKTNLIITTGVKDNLLINQFLPYFKKINNNLFEKKFNDRLIQLYINIDFFDLEFLIENSNLVISCHGASTHLASAYNIKIYDIFDYSQKNFYLKWIAHIKNYSYFYRENFSDLSKKILNKI